MDESAHADPIWISHISVKGLHGRLDFDVEFHSGINIIYGKNGIGKTTLLHIIANLSELDFDRFRYLNFSEIEIENNYEDKLVLSKNNEGLHLEINGQATSYKQQKNQISDAEKDAVRRIVGQRATYLPAFRSVLERMRENSYGTAEERALPNFDQMVEFEDSILQESKITGGFVRRRSDVARSNILKTIRCRQWFGEFVPAVRYPSISDVVGGLSDEWERAQLMIGRREQQQFEAAFVDIFTAISQGPHPEDGVSESDFLNEIRILSPGDEADQYGHQYNYNSIYSRLIDIARNMNDQDISYNHVLKIYVDILRSRKENRSEILKPINDFIMSVNKFLTEKLLNVGVRSQESGPAYRRVGAYISPAIGREYSLTALSSGERQIIAMLYSASRTAFRHGCLLIDEPELSLHIDWQRIIVQELERQNPGRQIIACTHSPEVGADHHNRVLFFTPVIAERNGDEAADIEDTLQ